MNSVDKRIAAQDILASNKSDDLKLFEIFELYKEDLRKDYTDLYYALLGWKDEHLSKLRKNTEVKNRSNTETFTGYRYETRIF